MTSVPTPASLAVRAFLAAVLRHLITLAGAALVARGIVDEGTARAAVEPIVAYLVGALLILAGTLWSGLRSVTHARLRAAWAALTGEEPTPPAGPGAAAVLPVLLALMVLPGLSGCVGLAAPVRPGQVAPPVDTPTTVAAARARLDELTAAYARVRGFVEPFLAFVPEPTRTSIQVLADRVQRLLDQAAHAATTAERLMAIEAATRELGHLRHVAGA
jgi:hypothetical protein